MQDSHSSEPNHFCASQVLALTCVHVAPVHPKVPPCTLRVGTRVAPLCHRLAMPEEGGATWSRAEVEVKGVTYVLQHSAPGDQLFGTESLGDRIR